MCVTLVLSLFYKWLSSYTVAPHRPILLLSTTKGEECSGVLNIGESGGCNLQFRKSGRNSAEDVFKQAKKRICSPMSADAEARWQCEDVVGYLVH
ncbi:hypothetical protein M758_11G012100 [Ceratodon purpureus]|nr:hypothetical protein M758_11G012100 [Ceratodon purpureus]